MVVAAVVTAACIPKVDPRPVPVEATARPTPAPGPVSFPRDEGRHSSSLEWWYYSGHLRAEGGEEYGFHFVVFRALLAGRVAAYSSQFGFTDPARGTHVQTARLSVGDQPATPDELELSVGGWTLGIGPDGHQIATGAGGAAGPSLAIKMQRSTPPMLHNEIGWIAGPTGWTYYYSWPRMAANGVLTVNEQDVRVTGEVWMDHQWGDFFVLGYPSGWQWFAVQLEDGSNLMLQEFRDANGQPVEAYGTLMPAPVAGVPQPARTLRPGEYSIEVLSHWRSPNTGADYPASWRLRVPGAGLDLGVTPVVPDQEITLGVPVPAIYWEGLAAVRGTKDGQPVAGRAYVELTGYVVPPAVRALTPSP